MSQTCGMHPVYVSVRGHLDATKWQNKHASGDDDGNLDATVEAAPTQLCKSLAAN